MFKKSLLIFLLLAAFIPFGKVSAQDTTEPPTYIVQPGDTLGIIASRFGVSVNDIIAENEIADPNAISVGAELRIPGLDGIQGRLTTSIVPLGNNYQELLISRQLPEKQFIKLNRITSPAEIVAGAKLLMPEITEDALYQPYETIKNGQSALELALIAGKNPWNLIKENHRPGSWDFLPAEQLFLAGSPDQIAQNPVSPLISSLEITPLPLVQGKTTVVQILSDQPLNITGSLAGNELSFFEDDEGQYNAIQGIYAREDPGLALFEVHIQGPDGAVYDYAQFVLLESGNFGQEAAVYVDPNMIDPAVTEPEEELLLSVTQPVTPVKYWDDTFSPLTDEPCINAPFGNSRSYNNGAYLYFHTGVDFGVCAQNLNIYAPAAGVVVFTGPLTIRGNATIIDHGHGVYSGIWHQSETFVKKGDQVTPGMLIGTIGNTGRSTGPHLHWEVWVGGVQVNPLEWLNTSFP
jgi:murein DD-endopeptidase MepM/ murein hydrolase activator NlpD